MVRFNNVYYSLLFLVCAIALASCGGESEPTAEEKVKKILIQGNGTWEPSLVSNSITLEGIDVAEELFPGFTIRFTEDKIFTTSTNDSPVWLREDTWQFKEGTKGKVIIRGMDDKEITLEEVSSSQLVIKLDWDQTTYGSRTASLPGLYEFILDK